MAGFRTIVDLPEIWGGAALAIYRRDWLGRLQNGSSIVSARIGWWIALMDRRGKPVAVGGEASPRRVSYPLVTAGPLPR